MPEHHFRQTHPLHIYYKKVSSKYKQNHPESNSFHFYQHCPQDCNTSDLYHVFPRSSQSYDSDVSLEVKESVSLPTKKQNSYTFVLSPPTESRHFDTKRKRTIF